MTASTEAFLALQRLYRERMEADAAAVEARAAALLKKLGRDAAPLRRGAVRQFVKNARNLRCGPQLINAICIWCAAAARAVRQFAKNGRNLRCGLSCSVCRLARSCGQGHPLTSAATPPLSICHLARSYGQSHL